MKKVIISGGPGAGKTTLIEYLAHRGFHTFSEVPRQLIEVQSQRVDGILPWHDLPAFAQLCLDAMCQHKQQAEALPLAFFDRAIGDICGYLTLGGFTPDEAYLQASQDYYPQVFVCRPQAAIYVQDEIRPYPFEQALDIHRQLVQSYQVLGYEVVEVPWASVEQRSEFILSYVQ
ncbi:AAA family ATPase [Vibrio olivae]|uniref:AAA family ATPase n=1 Tax=Vibrio olivae TaxID=1243002 RepID=A0ABV5HQB7_9VIBR